jgi:Fe-Mn family superoxide dismutase
MRGTLTLALSTVLLPSLSASAVLASEQQPFEFGEMSAPQYILPPLPYAYDVSILNLFAYPAYVILTLP